MTGAQASYDVLRWDGSCVSVSTHEALFKACTSVSSPPEKKACEKADKAFSSAIVDAIRSGATLPAPGRRP